MVDGISKNETNLSYTRVEYQVFSGFCCNVHGVQNDETTRIRLLKNKHEYLIKPTNLWHVKGGMFRKYWLERSIKKRAFGKEKRTFEKKLHCSVAKDKCNAAIPGC